MRSAYHLTVALGFALSFVLALVFPSSAEAHAFLVRTSPQAGERLNASPDAIVIEFSEPVVAGSEEISLVTSDGAPVALGAVQPQRGGATAHVSLPKLEDGIYRVSWQVLATDSHVSSGEFAFAVGMDGDAPVGSGTSSASVSWPSAGASWLLLAGLALALGGLASEVAIWTPLARRHEFAPPAAPVGSSLMLALAGAGLSFVVVASGTSGGGLIAGLDPGTWGEAVASRPGLIAVALVLLLVYALWLVLLRRTRKLALVPLLGAVVAAAWRGHSGVSMEEGLWWAVPANAVHLATAGLWFGALVHLILVLRGTGGARLRAIRTEAARRYAGLALPTVLLLLAAGIGTALAEIASLAQLVESGYGRLLLLKLAFVVAALGLAIVARWRAIPANPGFRPRLLSRLTGLEALSLLAAVTASAVLVSTAPPRPADAASELLGPPPIAGPVVRLGSQAGMQAVFLAAAEGQLELRLFPPGGVPAGQVLTPVSGRIPDGRSLDLYPRPCGRGCFSMAFEWQEGITELSVSVADGEWPGGDVQFAVPWPPQPEADSLLQRVIAEMRAQEEFMMTERVSSGPDAVGETGPMRLSGEQFIDAELYVSSGADDVRVVEDESEFTSLVLYLPGSTVWYRLWIDDQDRVVREVIVNPGHLIERSFSYESPRSRP